MSSLIEKQEEALRLTKKLVESTRIKALWPDAFIDGNQCAPCRVEGMRPHPSRAMEIKRAYLKRTDGMIFKLTINQYLGIFS